MNEEEAYQMAEKERERRKSESGQRKVQTQKDRLANLRQRAVTDREAAAELAAILERKQQDGWNYRAITKERMETDPEFAEQWRVKQKQYKETYQ
jgi:hypothetical protein